MTTKDKLEFVYLMSKHTDATLSDMQRLLRYGQAVARGSEQRRRRMLNRILEICDRFGTQVKVDDGVFIVSSFGAIRIPTNGGVYAKTQ